MPKLIIANWKSNPRTSREAIRLAQESVKGAPKNVAVVLCPPLAFLEPLSRLLKAKSYTLNASLGSQDLFWQPDGPYTGEVSWEQLKKLGVSYAILGHSERRRLVGETDEMVNKKVIAALENGITPILCVGESWEVHKKGPAATKKFVATQLKKDLDGVYTLKAISHKLVMTYEPVWAISTSRGAKGKNNADTPANAAAMIRFIKSLLAKTFQASSFKLQDASFIYGGSVNPKNAKGFLAEGDIEGALVGGASLKPAEFRAILKTASKA